MNLSMTIEMQVLLYAAILGILQLFAATHLATLQRGLSWNLSPRDQNVPELTGMAGRMDRAFKNFKETFVFFVVAVLLVQMTNRSSDVTMYGAWAYLTARVLYIPLYAFGIPGVRSLIWLISFVGIAMVLSALF